MNLYQKWIFAVSVLANILLVGFIAGRETPPPFHHRHKISEESLEKLTPEKRELFETMLQNNHKRREERFKQVQEIRKQVITILTAPEFDEEKFIAKSKELDSFFSIGKRQMISDMAALARQCNREERKILAEYLRRPPPPMGPPPGEK